jgi:phosphate transport system regulatory protein PhoU
MGTTGHTVKAFDDDLGDLRALIAEMGGLAENAIEEAMRALTRRDTDSAQKVVENDRRIDVLEAEVERLVVRLIALRAPMADDLREVLAALKISGIVERIGDYAKNIAKRVPVLANAHDIEAISLLPAMGRAVSKMVRDVLNAFAARDAKLAAEVRNRDKEVDDFYNSLFRTLLTHMMENPHTITASTHLLFIGKNLERMGDHATNIAEMVYYAATGEQLGERIRGGDALALNEA